MKLLILILLSIATASFTGCGIDHAKYNAELGMTEKAGEIDGYWFASQASKLRRAGHNIWLLKTGKAPQPAGIMARSWLQKQSRFADSLALAHGEIVRELDALAVWSVEVGRSKKGFPARLRNHVGANSIDSIAWPSPPNASYLFRNEVSDRFAEVRRDVEWLNLLTAPVNDSNWNQWSALSSFLGHVNLAAVMSNEVVYASQGVDKLRGLSRNPPVLSQALARIHALATEARKTNEKKQGWGR